VVLVIDRWGRQVGEQEVFDRRLRSFLGEVCPNAKRVIFVAQVPVLEKGEYVNLREYVLWAWNVQKAIPRMYPDSNESVRKQALSAATAATADFQNLRVLRADLPFYEEDGSIRYVSGRTFFYADDDHLTDLGAEQARGLFECAIAEAHKDV
jgi:hypothetical protein